MAIHSHPSAFFFASGWPYSYTTLGWAGFELGGGVDRTPWLDPPPAPKRAQLTEPPKSNLGTFMVRMVVVFMLKDTWSPVSSGYACL